MKQGDLITVTRFFLLPGESVTALGKQIKETCSDQEIAELAELIRAAQPEK